LKLLIIYIDQKKRKSSINRSH